MECHDYADTSTTHDKANPVEFVYKMSAQETQDFVKLRISNQSLFSGKRNASMCGWRAILKHMGLQHKMTHYQASKKWENMKKKYKDLKNPPEGVTVFIQWPYFSLMDDAIEGRLEGSAPILTVVEKDFDNEDYLSVPRRKKKKASSVPPSSDLITGPEVEVTLNGEMEDSQDIGLIMQEVDDEKKVTEKYTLVMEREHLLLQRERAALDREIAALERDRASLDRDRAAIEREKALLERERALVEKERDAVSKERQALEREKARLERSNVRTEEDSENIATIMDRKERFLFLFEKLIDHF